MRRGTARRALAPVGLAMLMIAGIAGPALACDPRLADLHDSRSYPDAASAVEPASAPGPGVDATTRAISTITPGTVNRSSVDLTARYLVGLTLGFSSRSFQANTIATITASTLTAIAISAAYGC